jgi:putative addiction module CopG family antidote
MQITIPADVEKVVQEKLDSGAFANAEEVVRAALLALQQQADNGDIASGELDALLAEGEASIERDGMLDGEAAFATRRERRASGRGTAK